MTGAFVGAVPLLKKSIANGNAQWQPADCGQLCEEIGTVFGLPVDMSSKMNGLKAICNALNEGNIARAQIATVLLGIPDPPLPAKGSRARSDMIKFIRDLDWSGMIRWNGDTPTETSRSATRSNNSMLRKIGGALTKADYNLDEPRDEYGRWTDGENGDESAGSDSENAFLHYGTREPSLSDGVYRPDVDPAELEDAGGSPEQLRLNRLVHDEQVLREMNAWWKKGFVPTPNVTFEDPRTGTRIVADYVVSMWVPDPAAFFLFPKLEPILVRDVKTGSGGLTGNQKEVYPYILNGGEVVPVGDNAAWAGFEVGGPTVIAEMYVGRSLPSDIVH